MSFRNVHLSNVSQYPVQVCLWHKSTSLFKNDFFILTYIQHVSVISFVKRTLKSKLPHN